MMSEVLYWFEVVVFRSLIYLYRLPMAIYYWGKGKSVPPITNPLLLKSAKSLAKDIRDEKLKSKEVVQAYIDRIQEVEPYLNAVVQDRFKEALEEALKVDELLQSRIFSKQQLEEEKPLLGVPFTVKLALKVKGFRCTAGSKIYKDLVADEDAPSITLLKNAGGILLATTNIPEFSLSLESCNFVHGRTCNPYNTSRTPGGSTGGECALLGAGASAVGIGNDVGGSLRIPAHFCGVFAHKGTRDLVINRGMFPVPPDELYNYICTGPVCRFPEDLVLMMKILTLDNEKNVKFDKKVDFKKLKIFYLTQIRDGKSMAVDNEIVEVIHKATLHFSNSYGVTAQELKVPHLEKMNHIYAHLIQAPVENFAEYLTDGKVKQCNTFSELVKLIFGNSNFTLGSILMFRIVKFPVYIKRRYIPYYRELLKKMIVELDNVLDSDTVIITPTFPKTATYHTELNFLLALSASFTSFCNFTGLPATAVPMGFNKIGMPLGIQIIGKKNNDPLTIACAEELGKVFGGWIPPGKR